MQETVGLISLTKCHSKVSDNYLYICKNFGASSIKVMKGEIKVVGKSSAKASSGVKKMRTPLTLEAEENQMIALAFDLAKKRLLEGTATSSEIVHFLKLGSTREKQEQEMMKKKMAVMEAQVKEYESGEDVKKMMEEALQAFRGYKIEGEEEVFYD